MGRDKDLHRQRLLWSLAAFALLVVLSLGVGQMFVVIQLDRLLKQEAINEDEHRHRNEQLHHAVCERQNEMARALKVALRTECPPSGSTTSP